MASLVEKSPKLSDQATNETKVELSWKRDYHTSLVKSLLSKRRSIQKDEIKRVKALNAIYPNADSSSTWVNTYSYSTSDCAAGNAITINALVSGVCLNYEDDTGINSLQLTCSTTSSKFLILMTIKKHLSHIYS